MQNLCYTKKEKIRVLSIINELEAIAEGCPVYLQKIESKSQLNAENTYFESKSQSKRHTGRLIV
jgi:hypothetical protein